MTTTSVAAHETASHDALQYVIVRAYGKHLRMVSFAHASVLRLPRGPDWRWWFDKNNVASIRNDTADAVRICGPGRCSLRLVVVPSPDIDVVKRSVLLTLALATLWMLWSGHLEPLLLGFGALSIAFVVWFARRMHVVDRESYPFGMVPRLSGYWFWLLKEIVKSNIDVTRRVFGPSTAVKPVVFDAPTSQQTDLGVVIYANSITLTPGTVSLDIGPGAIRVHAIHPDVARGLLDSGMGDRVRDTEQA